MIGGGKYEKEVDDLIRSQRAELVVLIICNGIKGSGFSVAVRPSAAQDIKAVADVLRQSADEIEKDFKDIMQRQ